MANTKYYVSKEKLGLYDEKIKKYISDADAEALKAAKEYADGLEDNYDAAGSAASALSEAKGYTDTEVAKANTAAATAQAAADAAQGTADAAQAAAEAAQSTADGAVAAIEELAGLVGDIPEDEKYADVESVIGYVDRKAEETLAAAQGGSSETAASVKLALDNYKTENNAKVNKNIEDIAAAQAAADDALAHSQGVAEGLAEAIEALEGADADQVGRIEALEGQITGLSGAMHFKGVIEGETLPETTDDYANGDVVILGDKEYVVNGGKFVELGDVSAEGERLTAIEGRVGSAEGRISTLEGEIPTINENISKKVDATAYDVKIAALEGADSGLDSRIKAIEDKFGEGEDSVGDMIQAAADAAQAAAIAEAEKKDATLKTAIETAYKEYVDGKDSAMNDRVAAVEADKHAHSNKALLDTYTQTEANLADAVNKKHEHANADVINAIEAANITTWNTVTSKASQSDLDVATGRIDTLEAWHAAFTECSEDDINNLFN